MRFTVTVPVAVSQSNASPRDSFWMTMVSGRRGLPAASGVLIANPCGFDEPERAVIESPHVESALVHQPVMGRAQQDEVVERGLPAVGPVLDVMAVEPMGGGAAGEAAPAVAARERAAHRRRDAAGAPPDTERLAVRAIDDGDDACVAAQPTGGLRRDSGAVLNLTASRSAVCKHFGFDMDHDFMPVRCKHRDIGRLEQPLGHPRQRIGTAHRA